MQERIMTRLRGSVPSYRKLFDGKHLPDLGLDIPQGVENAHEYAPLDGPEAEHDMYYVVLDQEQKEKMVDPYIDALNTGTDLIAQHEYDAVNVVYKMSGRKLILSRVNSGAKIGENGRTILAFGENGVEVVSLSFGLDYSGEVDAYYDGMDRIYFSKFKKAKPLFKDFDEFYQEAWYEDKELFLGNDLFDVGEIEPDDINSAMTKQIAEIRANNHLNLDDKQTVENIKNYIKNYPLSGVILNSNSKIKITTKDDLKCTVKLLTQRYYTSEITGEVLEARGSQKMKDQKAKVIFAGQEVTGLPDNR